MRNVCEERAEASGIVLKGRFRAVLEGAPGEIKRIVEGPNVVCTNGKEWLASFFASAAATAATLTAKYIAIGTGTTAESAAQTAMVTETARVSAGAMSYVSNQIYRVIATFASGTGTGAVTEYGLFTSSANGTMISRDLEDVINKGANDTLTVQYELTIS